MKYRVIKLIHAGEICSLCYESFRKGYLVCRTDSGRLAHFKCAKSRNWKKVSKTPAKRKIEQIERDPQNMTIRVIKKGS